MGLFCLELLLRIHRRGQECKLFVFVLARVQVCVCPYSGASLCLSLLGAGATLGGGLELSDQLEPCERNFGKQHLFCKKALY